MENIKQNCKKYFTISKNNTIYKITAQNLINILNDNENLHYEDLSGEIQRNIDGEHLQNLIKYQEKYYQQNKIYSFPVPFVFCSLSNKLILVDGQHRYECIKHLHSKNSLKHYMLVSVITIKNIEEYETYFIAINHNKPVILYKNMEDWKNVLKKLETKFKNEWPMYIKNTENPQLPHLNLDKMKQYIDDNSVIKKLGLSAKEFMEEIKELNNFYKLYWKQSIKDKNYIKNIDTLIPKCTDKNPDNPLYLSIYKNFEWIDRIVYKVRENIDYNMMEHMPKSFRIKIPKKLREKLWKSYFETSMLGKCYVCVDDIEFTNFECGHVVSVFYGGKNDLDNLRPVCHTCNNDMGAKDMEEYKNLF